MLLGQNKIAHCVYSKIKSKNMLLVTDLTTNLNKLLFQTEDGVVSLVSATDILLLAFDAHNSQQGKEHKYRSIYK